MRPFIYALCALACASAANAKVTDAMLEKLDNPKAAENFRSQRERAASLFSSTLQPHIDEFKKKLGIDGDLKMTIDKDSFEDDWYQVVKNDQYGQLQTSDYNYFCEPVVHMNMPNGQNIIPDPFLMSKACVAELKSKIKGFRCVHDGKKDAKLRMDFKGGILTMFVHNFHEASDMWNHDAPNEYARIFPACKKPIAAYYK